MKVVLVPLKRFRAAVNTERPQNKVKPPRALMTEIRGESSLADLHVLHRQRQEQGAVSPHRVQTRRRGAAGLNSCVFDGDTIV